MSYDLSRLGWDDIFVSAYRRFDRIDCEPGRVLRVDRGVCTVLAAGGVRRASLAGSILLGAAADPAHLPCAGDWVVLRRWPDRRVTVELVLPRRTALVHGADAEDATGELLGANMDTVAVVERAGQALDLARITELLASARASGAASVVALIGCDGPAAPPALRQQLDRVAPGVPVLAVSLRRPEGVEPLRAYVSDGRTLALLGRSGVGASTLVSSLLGAAVLPRRTDRAAATADWPGVPGTSADGVGRRARTCLGLVPLAGGGAVLDTPGIGESGAKPMTPVGGLADHHRRRS